MILKLALEISYQFLKMFNVPPLLSIENTCQNSFFLLKMAGISELKIQEKNLPYLVSLTRCSVYLRDEK